jgi:16S rRNA G966 N2-methylase RsmD
MEEETQGEDHEALQQALILFAGVGSVTAEALAVGLLASVATRHSACAAKVCATNQLKALIVGAPEELRVVKVV